MSTADGAIIPSDAGDGTTQGGLFLVGAERSGTTMLRLMLDHHPEIAWQNEFEYAVDMLGDDGRVPDPVAYGRYLDNHRVFRATGYAADLSLGYHELVRGFLEQRRTSAGKSVVGATVHRHFDRLLHVWPNARFIHLVRDPRDVAPSVIKMGWAGNAYDATGRWVHAERAWDRVRSSVGEARCAELHFEALLRDPGGALERLCSFIGVPYSTAMLAFHEDTTYERPDRSASQRWRSALTAREIGLIEGRAGPLLQARGYEPSGERPVVPGRAGRAMLGVQNRLARIRWRIGRYGFWLYARGVLAKRISPTDAWPKLLRRMQDIDREHLR